MATVRFFPPSSLETHARELVDKFSRAFNEGDINTIVSLFSTDAIVMAPNTPMLTRATAIYALYTSFVNMGCRNVNMEVTRITPDSDVVVVAGTYSLDIDSPIGPKMSDHGKFLCIQEEQASGEWKFLYYMWNSDMPLETRPTK